MAAIDNEKLHKTLSEFLDNKFWAKYYGDAPSVAKEFIALEMYASDYDVDGDSDFDNLQKEIEESMEDEDKEYLAKNSPSQYERARFAKMIKGEEGDGGEEDDSSDDEDADAKGGKGDGDDGSDGDDGDASEIDGDELKIGEKKEDKE